MAQQQDAVVVNMGDLSLNPDSNSSSKKKQDTLFGPNIGIVAKGPEWTESHEKAIDELTPDIVRGWIAKSKEVRRLVVYSQSAYPPLRCARHRPPLGAIGRFPHSHKSPISSVRKPTALATKPHRYCRLCDCIWERSILMEQTLIMEAGETIVASL